MDAPHKKRILYVITKSNWGGAQRYLYDLATHLPGEEYEIAVALGGDGLLKKKLEDAGIRVLSLAKVQRNLSFGADVGGFFSIYRALREYRPDIVHLNSSKAGGLGALAARFAGVPRIIFTAHGWPFEEKRNIVWRLFVLLASYATALLSHAVIVVSRYDLKIGRRMPFCARKMHLIHNGIDEHLPLAPARVIRHAFPVGAHITGTIGELTKNKNQIALVEEAHRTPEMFVAIVGEGEERMALEAKIEAYGLRDRIKLFGFLPASEALHGFDTFALPSLKEGLPYVLLEAKAAGLPIVANRIGGIPDILDAKDMSEFSLARMLAKTLALYAKNS